MRGQIEGAGRDALDGLDRVDHFEQRQFLERSGDREPAVESSPRVHDLGSGEVLENLRQVRLGDTGVPCDFSIRLGLGVLRSEEDDGSQSVLCGPG